MRRKFARLVQKEFAIAVEMQEQRTKNALMMLVPKVYKSRVGTVRSSKCFKNDTLGNVPTK